MLGDVGGAVVKHICLFVRASKVHTVRPESKLLVAPGHKVDTAVSADCERVGRDTLIVGNTIGCIQMAST